MCDRKRGRSDLKRGECEMSIAAREAFEMLNALQRSEYRGCGDTATAARDRAARKAGISPAQAERVWKRWQDMKTVNGDVYRALRNTYEAICLKVENAADAIEAKRHEIEDHHAAYQSTSKAHQRDMEARQSHHQADR